MKYKIEHEAKVKVEIIGAISKGQQGQELSAMGAMAKEGVVAFSDDGHYVENSDFMRKAMEYASMFHKIIIDHCEDDNLIEGGNMHEGVVSNELGMKGRPAVAEDIAVARDIFLAEATGTPVHIATSAPRTPSTSSARLKSAASRLRQKLRRSTSSLPMKPCAPLKRATK